MDKKPLVILIGILLVSVVLLAALSTVLKLAKEQKVPEREPVVQKESRAYTTLSATAAKSEVSVGEIVSIDIRIVTGDNAVTGVQLELAYDPNTVSIVSVSTGSFFTNPIELANKNDVQKGEIIFATSSFEPKKGTGTVATVRAQARKKTNGTIEVLIIKPTTLVSEFDNTQSVFKSAKGVSLVIR